MRTYQDALTLFLLVNNFILIDLYVITYQHKILALHKQSYLDHNQSHCCILGRKVDNDYLCMQHHNKETLCLQSRLYFHIHNGCYIYDRIVFQEKVDSLEIELVIELGIELKQVLDIQRVE